MRETIYEILKCKINKSVKQLCLDALKADDKQRKLDGIERVNNDVNGNSRFVCHFLSLITKEESDKLWEDDRAGKVKSAITAQYELALQKSRCIGGKKFHNKQFGGGIAFQVYSKEELVKLIDEVLSGERK